LVTGNNQFEKTSLQKSRKKRVTVTLLLVGLLLLAGGKWGWFACIPNWMAQRAIGSRNLEGALWWADLAKRLSFNSGESEFIIARTLRKQGRLDEVGEHLKRAASLGVHRDRVDREELLALAQSGEIARIQLRLDRMLIDQQGDGTEIAEAYANGLVICHRLEEAIAVLTAWQEAYPADPQANYARGRIYDHQGRSDDAELEYRAALKKDPAHHASQFALGRLLLSRNMIEEALEMFTQCESIPHNSAARINRSRCLRGLGRSEEALKILKEVVREPQSEILTSYRSVGEVPETLIAQFELGTLESALEHHAEAVPLLQQAVDFEPNDLKARYALAVALRGAGQRAKAAEEFERVQNSRSALREVDRLVDEIVANLGDPQIEKRFRVGELYMIHGSQKTAEFWLKSVLARDPNHKATHALLANYYSDKAKQNPSFDRLARQHASLTAAEAPQTASQPEAPPP
jgi:tetratricopeptide (TPR) repeat protein